MGAGKSDMVSRAEYLTVVAERDRLKAGLEEAQLYNLTLQRWYEDLSANLRFINEARRQEDMQNSKRKR